MGTDIVVLYSNTWPAFLPYMKFVVVWRCASGYYQFYFKTILLIVISSFLFSGSVHEMVDFVGIWHGISGCPEFCALIWLFSGVKESRPTSPLNIIILKMSLLSKRCPLVNMRHLGSYLCFSFHKHFSISANDFYLPEKEKCLV